MSNTTQRYPHSLIHIVILLILGGSLLFINLGNRPLGGSEGRWGEIAKEMLITHDWIVPKINAFPYRDKPVGSYWLILLASLPGHQVTGVDLFLVPFILDYQLTHSDMSLYLLFKENIIRFFHPFDHKEPFYFYFYYVFITLSPWTLLLPFLIWTLKKNGIRNDEGVTFFSLWFVVIFVFLTSQDPKGVTISSPSPLLSAQSWVSPSPKPSL